MKKLRKSIKKRLNKWRGILPAGKDYTHFHSEIKASKAGINAYHRKTQSPDSSSPLLRRNIHRIEKALCFPVKKDSFASGYIEETIAIYKAAKANTNYCKQELQWAFEVLSRYFKETSTNITSIAKAKEDFYTINKTAESHTNTPYPYSQILNNTLVTPDQYSQLCRNRVSCRWFTKQSVEENKIHFCIRAASQAASACNRQPFQFLQIKNPKLKKKIVNLPFGTKGFGEDLPELFLVVGDLSNFALHRDRHLIYIDSGLAVSQFLLALVSQNLAGVPINWPDVDENHQELRKILQLEEYITPIMLIGCGYPAEDAMIPFSQKKDINTLLKIYE